MPLRRKCSVECSSTVTKQIALHKLKAKVRREIYV